MAMIEDDQLTPTQGAAIARLLHVIDDNRVADDSTDGHAVRLVVLIGAAGVGKTLVLDRVVSRLSETAGVVTCRPGEDLSMLDGIVPSEGVPSVLVLDDAHRLSGAALRTLEAVACRRGCRTPSNRQAHRLSAIVCAGRGRLMTLLMRHGGLASRVALRAAVGPMTAEETARVVSREGGDCDPAMAVRIHELSGGVPRAVIRMCRVMNLLGSKTITAEEFERIDRRMSLPAA